MFEEQTIKSVACGSNHIVVQISPPKINQLTIENIQSPEAVDRISKKRPIEEVEGGLDNL